tara:strand:- start:5 stop:193 length:189 start_codon:yes stop_codon:yes gene_type:complete
MKSSLKAELEKSIRSFLDKTAEHEDRPEGYVHPEICEHMTNAAEAVYDATFSASQTAERESA